ncbi:unnamed protein product [Somion occarium]|uniref:Uncharacterized protein n=1 Tax=Somion occarium TaxID=3059160 RepID=A0ABP1DQB4_9APHY
MKLIKHKQEHAYMVVRRPSIDANLDLPMTEQRGIQHVDARSDLGPISRMFKTIESFSLSTPWMVNKQLSKTFIPSQLEAYFLLLITFWMATFDCIVYNILSDCIADLCTKPDLDHGFDIFSTSLLKVTGSPFVSQEVTGGPCFISHMHASDSALAETHTI